MSVNIHTCSLFAHVTRQGMSILPSMYVLLFALLILMLCCVLFHGDSIHAVVPGNLVANYIDSLHEMAVYELALFEVSARPPVMSPVQNPLVIMFTQLMIAHPVLNPDEMFPEWTYSLKPFGDLPAPNDTPARLIDVIGVVRSISYIATHDTPGRAVPTNRRCVVLPDRSGHQINVNLWGVAAFLFNGQVIHFLGQNESAVVVFVGMTIHSHEGSNELAGETTCR